MTSAISARELKLEIAYNVRHLGGYATTSGAVTRDTVIRSASIHRLSPASLETLHDVGVRTIVDLRSEAERVRDVTPDVGAYGIRKVVAPVWDVDASPPGMADGFPGYATVYPAMLERGRDAYRRLAETIADRPGRVLFHCAAGKDRTGVGSALLLELAGVPAETILDDHSHSFRLLSPMLEEWLPRMAERGIDREKAVALMASDAEDMAVTLGVIRERWGSAEGYLSEIGVGPDTLTALRARMVSEAR